MNGHAVVESSQDFRPKYRQLGILREYFTDDYNLYHDLSLNFNLNNNFGNSFLEFIARKHSSFEDYKKFIVTNCNLVEKLLYFIDSRTNQNQEEI